MPEAILFQATDFEGGYDDLGCMRLIKEREVKSDMPDFDGARRPNHRLAMFEVLPSRSDTNRRGYSFVVAVIWSDKCLVEYAVDQWTRSKEISGFGSQVEAEQVFQDYWPASLRSMPGEECAVSKIERVAN